ncbi:hypothetical protein [Geodermatophilus sp. URMC 64]
MDENDQLRRDLVARIEARRASVAQFLRANRPGIRRQATIAIVLSSLAAVFTAGPAVGGETFAEGVQKIFGLSSDSYVWRTLCLLALLVSIGAAVMSNLAKSHEAALNRLTTAEAAKAELEGLSTLLEFGHLSVDDGVKLFQQYSTKIPFVDDVPVLAAGRSAGPSS